MRTTVYQLSNLDRAIFANLQTARCGGRGVELWWGNISAGTRVFETTDPEAAKVLCDLAMLCLYRDPEALQRVSDAIWQELRTLRELSHRRLGFAVKVGDHYLCDVSEDSVTLGPLSKCIVYKTVDQANCDKVYCPKDSGAKVVSLLDEGATSSP